MLLLLLDTLSSRGSLSTGGDAAAATKVPCRLLGIFQIYFQFGPNRKTWLKVLACWTRIYLKKKRPKIVQEIIQKLSKKLSKQTSKCLSKLVEKVVQKTKSKDCPKHCYECCPKNHLKHHEGHEVPGPTY